MKCPMPMATPGDARTAREMACWGLVPVLSSMYHRVSPSRLRGTQREVSDDRLALLIVAMQGARCGTVDIGAIDVVQLGRRLIVVDGHHRATAAITLGWKRIAANIRKPVKPCLRPAQENRGDSER